MAGRAFSTEKFIAKSQKIHGLKYDYTQSVYIHSDIKIKIICSIHGEFLQKPRNHLCGFGCDRCSGSYKRTLEEFIQLSNLKHSNKYDYSRIEGHPFSLSKVPIICPIHGEFLQCVNNHLMNGQGCSKCSVEAKALKNKGPLHPFWRHDISLEEREYYKDRRYCLNYRSWKTAVHRRDNFTCQITGIQQYKGIHAHHIESWNGHKELRFDVNNGISLLRKIHYLFHKLYGKGNNTLLQFKEFKLRYLSNEFTL